MNKALEVIEALKISKNPILCVDSRPDFDALCASIILKDYLKSVLAKDVFVTFDGVIPESNRKLISDYTDISFVHENVCPARDVDFSKYDLQIFLDSGTIGHICSHGSFSNSLIKTLNIDHHKSNLGYGDINYVQQFASTCTTLFDLFRSLDIAINTQLASIYYLGLLLDTGFFQYDGVTATDFLVASELKKMGAKCYEINWKLTFNEKLDDMKLKGLVYSNLVYLPEHKIAYSILLRDEFTKLDINATQTVHPPADMIKKLEGTEFVFVVKELDINPRTFNLSLRSHSPDYNVSLIAAHFGGGGHKLAAGANIEAGDAREVIEKVLEYVKQL